MPKMSNFRSLEILFHDQLDFAEVVRDRFELDREVDLVERDGDFVEREEDREVFFLRLETDFCGKMNLQN